MHKLSGQLWDPEKASRSVSPFDLLTYSKAIFFNIFFGVFWVNFFWYLNCAFKISRKKKHPTTHQSRHIISFLWNAMRGSNPHRYLLFNESTRCFWKKIREDGLVAFATKYRPPLNISSRLYLYTVIADMRGGQTLPQGLYQDLSPKRSSRAVWLMVLRLFWGGFVN